MIDLHCHSHFSDGQLSPSDLLQLAIQNDVTMLALTDHDTVDGISPLIEANKEQKNPIQIIPGIELSVRWKKYDLHILGLNINPSSVTLQALIKKQQQSRNERAVAIAACMAQLGIDDALEKAKKIAGHEHIGRPHFAEVLVQAGKVPNIQAAFERYLRAGKPAYVPTPWISLEEAITETIAAGGDAVIAHPNKYKLTRTKLFELGLAFKMAGGTGVEVISGDMNPTQIQSLVTMANQYNLLASTGSDFHGEKMSRVRLGQQRALPIHCKPIWEKWSMSNTTRNI